MTALLEGATWRALGVDVHLLVTDPSALAVARALLEQDLADLDRACSRFRADSEVVALASAAGVPVAVSALLADAVATALHAAALTDGDVDPTLGGTMVALGYDRDLAALPADAPAVLRVRQTADWRDVRVEGGVVRLPPGVLLDLGATAKALGADQAAARIAGATGSGVLVNLGGDLSVAGMAPEGGWAVQVQDRPGEPSGPVQVVAVHAGGLATSSTTARRWRRGGDVMHHLLDPRTGSPARSPWRTISVAASDCVTANTLSTAAIVRGDRALRLLAAHGAAARLVGVDGDVVTVGGWPR